MKQSIIKKTIFVLVGFYLFTFQANAQSGQRISDTIPYEIIGDKLILSVKLNSKPTRFILDTGGVNLITQDSAAYHDVKAHGQQTIADVNSKSSVFYKGIISNLQLSENILIPANEVLITPPQAYFRDLGVAGALGGQAFANICVTFHSKEKYLVLTYPYRPKGISRNDGLPMFMGDQNRAIFPLKIGEHTVNTLFDTGMNGFFHLTNSDYEKIKASTQIKTIAEGRGIWHVGVSGVKGIKPEEIRKIKISNISVANKAFNNIESLTTNTSVSIIGRQLLEYGKVILDYPRGLFYFFPDSEEVEMQGITENVWNVNILPIIDHFEITATIGDAEGLKIGDRVWNINGTSLEDFPLDQIKIIELMENIETTTAYLLIGDSKENTRKVIIHKL